MDRQNDASGHSAPRKRKDRSQSQSEDNEEFDRSLSDWKNWLEGATDSDKES